MAPAFLQGNKRPFTWKGELKMNREFKLKVNAKWDLFLNVELEELLMYSGCRSLITYVMCAGISCQFVAF